MTAICPARVRLDFDSVDCRLRVGHDGLHECQGDGPAISWIEGCEHGSYATDGNFRVCLTCGDTAIDLNSRESLLVDVQQWKATLTHAMPATEALMARLERFVRHSVPEAPGRNGG